MPKTRREKMCRLNVCKRISVVEQLNFSSSFTVRKVECGNNFSCRWRAFFMGEKIDYLLVHSLGSCAANCPVNVGTVFQISNKLESAWIPSWQFLYTQWCLMVRSYFVIIRENGTPYWMLTKLCFFLNFWHWKGLTFDLEVGT